jgi:hypothetical protein
VVEHLPSKLKALISNPSIAETEREREGEASGKGTCNNTEGQKDSEVHLGIK